MVLSQQEKARRSTAGRANQKARTRQALIAATVELIREGKAPSIPDAAERALMSPATAYRYFSTAQALWEEASLEIVEAWDTGQVDQAGDDPRARLDAAVQGVGWHMLDDELPYRNLVRSSLERWYEQSALPDDETMPIRQGRRMAYNTKVVEPLRATLPDWTVDQLLSLALVWGTEAVLVLRDVCRLDRASQRNDARARDGCSTASSPSTRQQSAMLLLNVAAHGRTTARHERVRPRGPPQPSSGGAPNQGLAHLSEELGDVALAESSTSAISPSRGGPTGQPAPVAASVW
jgi:AcrR family transcriptional regulator